jgi:hypothetical protein
MGNTIKKNEKTLYAQQAARVLKLITGIDVFENTRRREVVETRALLVYILREVENMSLFTIRDFFRANGKEYDHSTVLHAQNSYPMYAKYNKKLQQHYDLFLEKSDSINSKKLLAKQIITTSDPAVAELFIYMVNKSLTQKFIL